MYHVSVYQIKVLHISKNQHIIEKIEGGKFIFLTIPIIYVSYVSQWNELFHNWVATILSIDVIYTEELIFYS